MRSTILSAAIGLLMLGAAPSWALPDIVRRSEVPVTVMAGWETGGKVHVASSADELAKAPKSAVRYERQAFVFPTGTLKVLRFKAAGGALYPITDEVELFVLTGAASVEVDGKPTTLSATDAVNLPGGVLRSLPAAADTTIIAWTVGRLTKDAKSMVVRGAGVRIDPVANWDEADGKQVYLRGAEQMKGVTPPAFASQWVSRRYEFNSNSIRWANFQTGGKTNLVTPQTDNLIYITKGRMRRTEGTEVEELHAGDVVREEAGLKGFWEPLEEPGFLSTTAPAASPR